MGTHLPLVMNLTLFKKLKSIYYYYFDICIFQYIYSQYMYIFYTYAYFFQTVMKLFRA